MRSQAVVLCVHRFLGIQFIKWLEPCKSKTLPHVRKLQEHRGWCENIPTRPEDIDAFFGDMTTYIRKNLHWAESLDTFRKVLTQFTHACSRPHDPRRHAALLHLQCPDVDARIRWVKMVEAEAFGLGVLGVVSKVGDSAGQGSGFRIRAKGTAGFEIQAVRGRGVLGY